MDMIFDAADVVQHPFLGSNDAADVRIEALCDIGCDPPLAVLG
jgi:hypothetical protein